MWPWKKTSKLLVHIVVVKGPVEQVQAAETILRAADGYSKLMPGAWLIASDGSAVIWRDQLKQRILGLDVFVAQVTTTWAAVGFGEATSWLSKTQRDLD